jgi:energy-converting hydrogenase Eha subunit A
VETETKNTIPLWLAVAITVVVSLPFGIWLGKLNLPLWAAFIVWAEYFTLGAKPSALKIMVPAYTLGVVGGALICEFYQVIDKIFSNPANTVVNFGLQTLTYDNLALFISFFVGFCILIYAMKWMAVTGGAGTLPFFNGVSVFLGVYFTGTFLGWFHDFSIGADTIGYAIVIFAAISAFLGGMLGAALGWFNVVILFPREVKKTS